jgi:hypothetical protein
MNSFDKELEILREMNKKYLKNSTHDPRKYRNGDGWAAYVMEKYGNVKGSERDNQKAD